VKRESGPQRLGAHEGLAEGDARGRYLPEDRDRNCPSRKVPHETFREDERTPSSPLIRGVRWRRHVDRCTAQAVVADERTIGGKKRPLQPGTRTPEAVSAIE